jgi:hypothetical protein
LETVFKGLFGVRWEVGIFYHKLMEVVSEKISASGSSMTIIDPKETALGPIFILSLLGLQDVQDNGDPILVIVPHEPLVSVCCIRSDHPIPLE